MNEESWELMLEVLDACMLLIECGDGAPSRVVI